MWCKRKGMEKGEAASWEVETKKKPKKNEKESAWKWPRSQAASHG